MITHVVILAGRIGSDHGEINGSPVVRVLRATQWTRRQPVRLFVTADRKIWIGYGESPEGFSLLGEVPEGERMSRAEILDLVNA